MRRNKDDKRVLRSGNGRQTNSRRKKRNSRQLFSRGQKRNNVPVNPRNRRASRRKRKSNGKLVFVMIVALIAFVIGAGIGVSLSFNDGNADEGPKFVNVTNEMTTNISNTSDVIFDKSTDGVDFNENTTPQLDVSYRYSEE